MRRRTFLAGTLGICSGFAFNSILPPALPPELGLTTVSGPTMGTYFRLIFPDAGGIAVAVEAEAVATLAQVDALMSTYRADSEVSRFNGSDAMALMQISKHTGTVIEDALRVGALTGGAFDITISPLVEVWGFGPAGRMAVFPDRALVAEAERRVGQHALKSERGVLRKTRSDVAIDLSGIAKGYAVDRLVALLDGHGMPAYLIDVGGELRAKGHRPDGQPWRVGIERPLRHLREVHRVVPLEDRAIATSGDYRNFFMHDGHRYTHAIDPRTAQPVKHSLASVTVLDRDAMTADALSTALMVMGPDEGQRFAEQAGVAAYFVAREDDRLVDRSTSAFEPWLNG